MTVYSSRLRIDCGCAPGEGEEVPVDWYIPENPDPERIIYLQHGFLAAGPWYSYTAATLAEQTNSIVVAPSITSNFLAYDQCWLGGAPMHQAMAGLFDPNNTALADSAERDRIRRRTELEQSGAHGPFARRRRGVRYRRLHDR